MKVLILNGSPKKNGNTATLLKAFEAGLDDSHRVEWVDVYDAKVKPCIGCQKCRPDKTCVLPEDDGHKIGKLINEADVLVIGSPVYWGNITAPLKAIFDRNVPVFEYIDAGKGIFRAGPNKGKKAFIVLTSGAPFPINQLGSQAGGAVRALKTVLNTGGYKINGLLNVGGMSFTDKLDEKSVQKAKRMGASV